MSSLVQRFNEKVPWPLRLLLIVAVGLCLREVVLFSLIGGWAATRKLTGRATVCPWSRIASYYHDLGERREMQEAYLENISIAGEDKSLNLTLISSPVRTFWAKLTPGGLADLLAEQDWVADKVPDVQVREGDIVLDCGAHVGVFTNKALQLGAAKVIAIEPNPVNLECLRRNFEEEIASGKVILVPKGVWSSETNLPLFSGASTAQDSLVKSSGSSLLISLTTIDRLVKNLNLPQVDYIKMDIEGAEREALKGALQTLRRFRPRLMLDHHREDDTRVIPEIIRKAHRDYALRCGPCEPFMGNLDVLVPHVTFYK